MAIMVDGKFRHLPVVKDGRVVKGVNFIDLIDAGDPVEQAKVYDRAGADEAYRRAIELERDPAVRTFLEAQKQKTASTSPPSSST